MGVEIGGFDMYTTSDVIQGSGISSSAAFENLISTSIDSYYNENRAGAVEIAKIGQFAENVYFGKNSGLMDQLVSSVGGFVFIDFADVDDPAIEKVDFDLESAGCKLIITDTKGSHCDLTADYDAVRSEMEAVAEYFMARAFCVRQTRLSSGRKCPISAEKRPTGRLCARLTSLPTAAGQELKSRHSQRATSGVSLRL